MTYRRLRRAPALCALLLLGAAMRARAQATPTVAPTAAVYDHLDRLVGAGLIDTVLVGVRPYSRREIVRMLNEARRNIGRLDGRDAWAAATIRSDLAIYSRRPSALLDEIRLEDTYLDSPARTVPADSNGHLDATINPLASNREGRPLDHGFTENLETFHSAEIGDDVALQLNPRLSIPRPDAPQVPRVLDLQSGAASALVRNLSVEAGRDYVIIGPEPDGGLLLSNNAPALTMLRLSNDAPWVFPWWLRLLGPVRGTVFLADLGLAHQVFVHSQLIGYHLAVQPVRDVELGAGLIDEMGGQGAPGATFGRRLVDLIPPVRNFMFSNKMAAFDAHWRAPAWRGLDVYLESALDDFDVRRIRSSLLEDGGWVAGLALHCLAECGRVGLRAEYHQTGIRFYTHGQFTSGVQEDGVILGDPLGPRGLGAYVTGDADAGRAGRLSVRTAFEVRGGDLYGSVNSGANDRGFHFVQILQRPAEKRARVLLSWRPVESAGGHVTPQLAVGVERVNNFNYTGGNRLNALAQVSIEVRP